MMFIMDHMTEKLTFSFYLIKNNLASAKEIVANINGYVYWYNKKAIFKTRSIISVASHTKKSFDAIRKKIIYLIYTQVLRTLHIILDIKEL